MRAVPATAAALNEVRLVFGTGPQRRGVGPQHRVWAAAVEAPRLVKIAAIGGPTAAETCHVVLQVLAPDR